MLQHQLKHLCGRDGALRELLSYVLLYLFHSELPVHVEVLQNRLHHVCRRGKRVRGGKGRGKDDRRTREETRTRRERGKREIPLLNLGSALSKRTSACARIRSTKGDHSFTKLIIVVKYLCKSKINK